MVSEELKKSFVAAYKKLQGQRLSGDAMDEEMEKIFHIPNLATTWASVDFDREWLDKLLINYTYTGDRSMEAQAKKFYVVEVNNDQSDTYAAETEEKAVEMANLDPTDIYDTRVVEAPDAGAARLMFHKVKADMQIATNIAKKAAKINVGDHVEVVQNSGIASGKQGIVISPREVSLDGRGIPQLEGEYKPWDGERNRKEVFVRYDNGSIGTMFKNRLFLVGTKPFVTSSEKAMENDTQIAARVASRLVTAATPSNEEVKKHFMEVCKDAMEDNWHDPNDINRDNWGDKPNELAMLMPRYISYMIGSGYIEGPKEVEDMIRKEDEEAYNYAVDFWKKQNPGKDPESEENREEVYEIQEESYPEDPLWVRIDLEINPEDKSLMRGGHNIPAHSAGIDGFWWDGTGKGWAHTDIIDVDLTSSGWEAELEKAVKAIANELSGG